MRVSDWLCDSAAACEPRVGAEAQVREDACTDGLSYCGTDFISDSCTDGVSDSVTDEAADSVTDEEANSRAYSDTNN